MQILSIFILDRNGNEKLSSHHSTKTVNLGLTFFATLATIRPKYYFQENQHCYIKKNAEKILLFICNEKMKTQGQINLFFTKIKHAKNDEELNLLRTRTHFTLFEETMVLSQHKLPPKNREIIFAKKGL